MLIDVARLASSRTRRSGVIPYTVYRGKVYFLLGKDAQFGELTDFGGQRNQFESSFATALREFGEESNHLFRRTEIDVDRSFGIIDDAMKKIAIMLIPVPAHWLHRAPRMFQRQKSSAPDDKHREIESVSWLTSDQFFALIDDKEDRKMWSKVRKFLRDNQKMLKFCVDKILVSL